MHFILAVFLIFNILITSFIICFGLSSFFSEHRPVLNYLVLQFILLVLLGAFWLSFYIASDVTFK